MAIGGSTNAIIHLVALAGRAASHSIWRLSTKSPTACPCLPTSGPPAQFLMEDFYYAGGLRALMSEMRDLLHLDCVTVNGETLGKNLGDARLINPDVIRPRENPLAPSGGTAIFRGNLAPDGAVIKTAAADAQTLNTPAPPSSSRTTTTWRRASTATICTLTENSVLVLQTAGPLGGPGMPEWGMLPIPQKLLDKGIRDMVRISDARMSGTSYGTCVLHVSPESYVGGPLALVEEGDLIHLDAESRKLDLLVSPQELAARRAPGRNPRHATSEAMAHSISNE